MDAPAEKFSQSCTSSRHANLCIVCWITAGSRKRDPQCAKIIRISFSIGGNLLPLSLMR